jgi:hypothetical protein
MGIDRCVPKSLVGGSSPSRASKNRCNAFAVLGSTAVLYCPTANGRAVVSVLVDTADLLSLVTFGHWKVYDFRSRYNYHRPYVVTHKNGKMIYMHRLLTGVQAVGVVPDHINRRSTDNRRDNLRLVSERTNQLNRGPQKSRHGRGVTFDPRGTKIKRYHAHCGGIGLGMHMTAAEAQSAVAEYLRSQGVQ